MDRLFSVKSYDAPKTDKCEILRYSGTAHSSSEIDELLRSCLDEVLPLLTYKVCFREFCISISDDFVNLGFVTVKSQSLARNLSDCKSAVVFGATVGAGPDRMISRYSRLNPSRALMHQAIGAERIEALAEMFSGELCDIEKNEGKAVRTRFSPGYGDLPLSIQKNIFEALCLSKYLGLCLTDGMMMYPTKSVTAIIGIS